MRGVVVAPQPLAAEAGAAILAEGGNAFDAAIGAALVQMVTDPQMCGLGGFGCATYLSKAGCEHVAFHARAGTRTKPDMWASDFRGRTELGNYTLFDDHRSNLGHTSVGTPGVLAGLALTEARISQATHEALSEAGFDLRPIPQNYAAGFGRNQLISIGVGGSFSGASDPRRDGGVAAYSNR